MANLKPDLQRVRYWQGQRLTAADLREQVATDLELRRLHDQCAHRAIGVAIGLAVKLEGGHVEVEPGLAYDCASRMLLLLEKQTLDLPELSELSATSSQRLVLRIDADDPSGVALGWQPDRDRNARDGVAIAAVKLIEQPGGSSAPGFDPEFRPLVARRSRRQYSGEGQTLQGETNWQPWIVDDTEVGVEVFVDTSMAGFTWSLERNADPEATPPVPPRYLPPHYFARIVQGRPDVGSPLTGFVSLMDLRPDSFKLRLLLEGVASQSMLAMAARSQIERFAPREPTPVGKDIVLSSPARFYVDDELARLHPLASRASLVQSIAGKNVRLDTPLPADDEDGDETDDAVLAILARPRFSTVKAIGDAASASLSSPGGGEGPLLVGDFLARPPDEEGSTRLSEVVAIFERVTASDGRQWIKLGKPFAHVGPGSTLRVLRQPPVVQSVKPVDNQVSVTFDRPNDFVPEELLLRMDESGRSTFLRVVARDGETITIATTPDVIKMGDRLGRFSNTTAQLTAELRGAAMRSIELEDIQPFRLADIVAKRSGGTTSAPVRIDAIDVDRKQVVLSRFIDGLTAGDRLDAALFRTRATIRASAGPFGSLLVLQVLEASRRFPASSFVATIDAQLRAGYPHEVRSGNSDLLLIDDENRTADMHADDVIGWVEFPREVTVMKRHTARHLTVSDAGVLQAGDVLLASTGEVFLVASAVDSDVELASDARELNVSHLLTVVAVGDSVTVQKAAGQEITLTDPGLLRVGDALGRVSGWRQAERGPAFAVQAIDAAANQLSVSVNTTPDGALRGNWVGLASVHIRTDASHPFRLRFAGEPVIDPGGKLSLLGLDRLRGKSVPARGDVGRVVRLGVEAFRIEASSLQPIDPGDANAELRPEDLSLSVQLALSALPLIRRQELFVSWIGFEDFPPDPERWPPADHAECECLATKES